MKFGRSVVNDGHQYGHNAHNLRVYKPRFGVAGDASGDGQITEADLTLLQQALNGQGTATMAMDCNQDGVVDNGDTPCIARQIGSNRNQGQGNGRGQGNGGGANGGPPPAPTTEPVQVGWVLFTHDEQGRLIGEYDEQGNPLRRYIWLNDTPVALIDQTGVHYIHSDHLNTPQVVTDSTGAISWHADYTPFGEVTERIAELEVNLRFPGQYLDRETGLHQNWHREYAPHLGRYTQSDPIGLGGGLNLYAYVSASPTRLIDPSGLLELTFRHHGNWGGPGWAAGREVRESDLNPEDFEIPPIDDRDSCYRDHDRCIWAAAQDDCPGNAAIRSCDILLSNCLIGLSPIRWSTWRTSRGLYFSSYREGLLFMTVIPATVHGIIPWALEGGGP